MLRRSLDDTAAGLGSDGPRWQSIFGRPSAKFDELSQDIMGPLLRVPNHPLALARFGLPTVLPASAFARVFRTERARALFGGVAAHTFRPLHYPMTSAIGLGIITAGHRHGWPVAAGGSQSITNALAGMLGDLGGKIETGVRIESASQLPPADVTMFDLAPGAIADILGDRLPGRVAAPFGASVTGPARSRSTSRSTAACPGPIATRTRQAPSTSAATSPKSLPPNATSMPGGCRTGRSCSSASSTLLIRRGRLATSTRCGRMPMSRTAIPVMPPRRSSRRSSGSRRGSGTGSSGSRCARPPQMAVYNPNYVGGDIVTGAKDIRQLVFGPRATLNPYRLGIPGMYICSAATPPGPGAHGMCGAHAAADALNHLHRRS